MKYNSAYMHDMALEPGEGTLLLLVDHSTAFDTVDHVIQPALGMHVT